MDQIAHIYRNSLGGDCRAVNCCVRALQYYRLQIPIDYCLLFIGLSIIANLLATYLYPENKRLSETENLLFALFDLFQLSALIYLTGGLNNPFSILVIAPVVISSSVLGISIRRIDRGNFANHCYGVVQILCALDDSSGIHHANPKGLCFWELGSDCHYRCVPEHLCAQNHSRNGNYGGCPICDANRTLSGTKTHRSGWVIAAAAHELGTPLATIKLTAGELVEDLSHDPDLKEDAELIRQEANRCRDILHSMGRWAKMICT